MNKLVKHIKESPIWLISVLTAVIAIIFFIFLPFQINLFPEQGVKKVYYVDSISGAHKKIINKFNEQYKNAIEIVPVNLPFYHFTTNDRKAVLTRSLRNKSDGIDIFAVDLIWIPRFAKWGYSIDRFFDKSMLAKTNKNALDACVLNDSLVAFPMFLDITVLHYREDLLKSLPGGVELEKKINNSITWGDFIDLGLKSTNTFNPYYVFTANDFEGMMCCFYEMLSVEERDEIFHTNEINLNTDSARRALKQMVDFIYRYNFSPKAVTNFYDPNSYKFALENDALFLRGWTGYNKQYKNFLTDTSKISSLKIAPLPHYEGENTSGVFGGWSLMISKFSKRREEAIKFIKFMFEEENQKILYEEAGVLPVNNNVYADSAYMNKHTELKRIYSILKWGKHRPSLENYTRISEIMSMYFYKALVKEISVEEALRLATEQINSEKAIIK